MIGYDARGLRYNLKKVMLKQKCEFKLKKVEKKQRKRKLFKPRKENS